MRRMLVLSLCAVTMLGALLGRADAAPVTFTLRGVTFQDGATASGSFDYDANTNTYSNVNITTTGGTILPGATYAFVCTPPCTNNQPTSQLALFLTTTPASDQTNQFGLGLVFAAPLTTVFKAVPLAVGVEATCTGTTCGALDEPGRVLIAGEVTLFAGPVPTLSEWGMILLVLSLLALGTWQLAGRPHLLHVATAGGLVLWAPPRRLLDFVLAGQIVAALGLGLYAWLIKPVVPQDLVGAMLSGVVLGILLECYRRGRER
jgi:IPTL-CTERM motif